MKYKVHLDDRTYEVVVEKNEAILLDEYESMTGCANAPSDASSKAPEAPAGNNTSAPSAPASQSASSPVAASPVADGEVIQAPLPGQILDIRVNTGDAVKSGQVLLLIEAMKMENEVLAPRDGIIRQVVAVKGSMVKTGDAVIVM